MARTVIAPQSPLGSYPSLPLGAGAADVTFTANTDPTDRYAVIVDNKTMLLAYNTDSVDHTITIGSAADTFNRKGDITTYSVAAGKVACFGPFKTAGWGQNTNQLFIDVSDAKLELANITLP